MAVTTVLVLVVFFVFPLVDVDTRLPSGVLTSALPARTPG